MPVGEVSAGLHPLWKNTSAASRKGSTPALLAAAMRSSEMLAPTVSPRRPQRCTSDERNRSGSTTAGTAGSDGQVEVVRSWCAGTGSRVGRRASHGRATAGAIVVAVVTAQTASIRTEDKLTRVTQEELSHSS